MRKKILLFTILLPFVFFGCTASKGPKAESRGHQEPAVLEEPIKNIDRATLERQCESIGDRGCYDLATSYYTKGDFSTAISIYDIGCYMYFYLPSCVQMGKMFEMGEGVQVNKAIALDIYERSCYRGHNPSCQDMKRLQ